MRPGRDFWGCGEKPQASLLSNTGGAGYFACCVIAPRLLDYDMPGRSEFRSIKSGTNGLPWAACLCRFFAGAGQNFTK